MFTEAFYLANYTNDHQVVLAEPIALRSGYDDLVEFTMEGGNFKVLIYVEKAQIFKYNRLVYIFKFLSFL